MTATCRCNSHAMSESALGLLTILVVLFIAFASLGCSREAKVEQAVVTSPGEAGSNPTDAVFAAAENSFDASVARVAAERPTTVKGWITAGRRSMDEGDFAAALAAADEALTLDAQSAQAHHVRGRALLALNRASEALDELQQARDLAPDNGHIANTLGYALILMGRSDDALPHLEAACAKLPQIAYVRNNLGVAYERTGQRDKAIAEYQAAVAAGDSAGKAAMSLARLGAPTSPKTEPVEAVAEGEAAPVTTAVNTDPDQQ